MKLKALVAGVVAAGALLGVVSTAGAAPEPSGWDDVNDQVVGSGSDTTYAFMQQTERLYNQAQGCSTNNSSGSPTVGQCLTGTSQLATDTKGNWDHDFFVSKYPTGSGAGIRELLDSKVDYARSSRGPNATGETALNFWGFAKDGIAIVTMGTRPALTNITLAQLQGIYNCTITDWSAITGSAADVGKTIEPVGMNPSSGTKATFQGFLGFDPNAGACVKKLADPDGAGPLAAEFPFENDLKPVLAAPTINEDNAIWWMSFGEYRAYQYKRQSALAAPVNGQAPSSASISSGTYPFTRFIYHVTKKTDATNDATTENVLGADTGKAGAVREFTEFLCKGSTSHSNNDFSGLTNYGELTAVYSQSGFIRLPTADRTNGVCRLVPGP